MADELAKVLTIPDSVTQKMDDVIEKINEIENASNKMADTVNTAWKSLANGEIDNYLKKLQDVANATSSNKISIDTTDITKAASEAERWAAAMAEVATQASNYAASKTATFAVQQEWNEALKALKEYEDARLRAEEQGTTVSPKAQASHDAILKRLEELRNAYPDLARIKDAAWDATAEKLYIKHLERVEKKNQQIEDKEERQAHSRALRAKQIEAANTRILILAEKLSREEGKSQHYAGLIAELQRLQEEYKKLGNSKEDAERRGQLEEEMEQVRASIQSADGAMRRLSNTTRGLFNYSKQLGRAFSLLFSVSAIKNYIRQIREVTAEFEFQRVALGSLLQSQEKANELFGQITNLAVRSPFTIKELNKYTKQLAAYNIQYENLFDTTKMLADVSAGLGVDIGRLILAFGQVKAATVLRGTEVRQFTEAGFGILGELAKYYTELEGKLVSVGDVQDRITKKMVKFADVEEIFKRVTSAGGMFYNMQEKMANTLYGKWSNLTDRIDLMLNEIGQSKKSVFNLLVDVAATLAENWEAVATAISLVVPAFVSFKISSAMAAANLKWFGKEASVVSIAVRGLGTALKSLLSPLSLVFLALEGAVYIWKQYNIEAEQATVRISKFNEQSKVVANAAKEFGEIERAEKNANETDEEFAKRLYDDKRASLVKFRSELQGIGFDISDLPDIKTLTNEQVDEEIKLLQQRAKAYVNFQNQIQFALDRGNQGWRYWFDAFRTIDGVAERLDKKSSRVFSALNYNLDQAGKSLEQIKGKIAPLDYQEFTEALTQRDGEDISVYLERAYKAVTMMQRKVKDFNFFGDTREAKRQQSDLLDNLSEYADAYEAMLEKLGLVESRTGLIIDAMAHEFGTGIDGLKAMAEKDEVAIKMAIDTKLAQKTWSEFVKTIVTQKIYATIGLKPDTDTNNKGNKELEDWQKKILGDDKLKSLFSRGSQTAEEFLKQYSSYQAFLDGIQQSYDDATAEVDKYNKQVAEGENLSKQELQTTQMRALANKQLAEQQAEAVGLVLDKTKKENKEAKIRNDYLKESVSLIQKMGKEYDDALDSMGKTAAKTDISTRYSSLLSDLADKAGMDGTAFVANLSFDTSGIISALQKVADAAAKAGATEAEQAAREAIAKIQGEDVKIEVKANVEGFERELDNAINQYQLGKELSKLGLGVVITGVPETSLDDLRAFVEKQKQLYTDENGELAKDYVKVFEDAEKKITEMQFKETQERWKKYATLLKQSVSERIRIEQETAKKIADVEAEGRFSRGQKDNIIGNIRKEAEREIDKLAWNDFKSSGMYLDLFENLDQASGQAIDNMLAELDKLRTSLDDLPPEQLKEIINQMNKLQEIEIEKAGFGDLIKNIREGVKAARELPKLEKQLQDARDTQKGTKKQNEERQRQYDVAQKQYDLAVKTYGENSKEAKLAKNRLGIAESYLILSNEEVENGEEQITNLSEQVRIAKLQKKLANSSISEMLSTASAVGDSISNLHGALTDVFGELPTGLEDAFIYAEGLFAGIGDFEKGLSDIMSGKVLSGAINTIAGLFRTIGGLFGIGLRDTRRERDIEKEVDLIEDLQKKYEDLEKSIETAYSSSTYDQAQDDAIANLEAQNKALERAQAAERDKKKTDQDRIDEWEQQKLDNLEKIAELERQAIEAYGGFGSDDNIKSAAEDFVSAWMDAFNETGDGLDALSGKMDEWLNNAIQKQLLMRLSEQYITPLLNQFDNMFSETSAGGRVMTKEEIEAWKRLYEQNSKEFDEKAKAYLDAIGVKPTGTESELSGLQRGIEGVTETTAQALEALLNSMRYYVSDTNGILRQFYASFMSADEKMNPMLYELKQHTTLLNAIHSLLNSTTKMTNNNGRALKVLMM